MERYYTDFLCPNSDFLLGAGSVFNVAGQVFAYNRSCSETSADVRAIRQDFAMIGQDIRDLSDKLKSQNAKQLELEL